MRKILKKIWWWTVWLFNLPSLLKRSKREVARELNKAVENVEKSPNVKNSNCLYMKALKNSNKRYARTKGFSK